MLILDYYNKVPHFISEYKYNVAHVQGVHHSSLQEIKSFENVLYGAGSELIRSELGAYGEKILGSGSKYVRNNVRSLFD